MRASSSSTCTAARPCRRLPDQAGAWTHYSRAIADALGVSAGLPAVEVHLSDVEARNNWRKLSVFDGLVVEKISGKGADGYKGGARRARPGSSG